ncbi:hypothetical protein [Rhizobium laguerreae]|uniref:hypothetical protein n=1 Tax=Rhizobium laguerreae TaxID=1076926 RepID=UPI001441586C|nr:hypothetical protein [Rhizobium laguerreae]NKM30767.1 hypothetical protein [Rhizobium laguerreae]
MTDEQYAIAMQAIDLSIRHMEKAVPAPSLSLAPGGYQAYRFRDKLFQQAILLKTVRIGSALRALKLLLDHGLMLDAGASMRILDELGSDVLFLAGPLVMRTVVEDRHNQFLAEFFQEEFNNADPLKSTQKRHRVGRREIRAYIARTYKTEFSESHVVSVTAIIDGVFSGFVHGAAVHTMDVFDGARFQVPSPKDHPALDGMRLQFPQYVHRSMMNAAVASKAAGCEETFINFRNLIRTMFDDDGSLR